MRSFKLFQIKPVIYGRTLAEFAIGIFPRVYHAAIKTNRRIDRFNGEWAFLESFRFSKSKRPRISQNMYGLQKSFSSKFCENSTSIHISCIITSEVVVYKNIVSVILRSMKTVDTFNILSGCIFI